MIALIHMRIPRSLLIVMCVTAPGAAIAQGPACPGGRASTATRLDTWVEPHAREVVAQQVFKSITELGYTFADTTGPYVTAPKFSWPTNSTFPLWRSLVYPGATLTIAVDTAGPWSRVRLETRLACDTDQRPPPGFPPDVDFQTFVVTETHDAAWRAIVSPLHRLKVRTFAQSCAPLPEGDDKIAVCRQMAKKPCGNTFSHSPASIMSETRGRRLPSWLHSRGSVRAPTAKSPGPCSTPASLRMLSSSLSARPSSGRRTRRWPTSLGVRGSASTS